jgi:hypothetical protein
VSPRPSLILQPQAWSLELRPAIRDVSAFPTNRFLSTVVEWLTTDPSLTYSKDESFYPSSASYFIPAMTVCLLSPPSASSPPQQFLNSFPSCLALPAFERTKPSRPFGPTLSPLPFLPLLFLSSSSSWRFPPPRSQLPSFSLTLFQPIRRPANTRPNLRGQPYLWRQRRKQAMGGRLLCGREERAWGRRPVLLDVLSLQFWEEGWIGSGPGQSYQ